MGVRLGSDDEGMHLPGDEINWNESRYIDGWDPMRKIGCWLRIGVRPNARYAEMSACVFLPDGFVGFAFGRPEVDANTMSVGDERGHQSWEIVEPWRANKVSFNGSMSVFDDGWKLTDPKTAFRTSPKAQAEIDLMATTEGLEATMGQDQDQHHLIFLPGQADFHYQHITRVTGSIRLGDKRFEIDGSGAKDHSWGPRNWHAKRWLRWLICSIDADNGFMLVRAVGPTKQTRSGFVWVDREFRVVDGFDMVNQYAGPPWYQLERAELVVRAGDVEWTATGVPQNYLPARHRQPGPDGKEAILRIVKQPAEWSLSDGRMGTGHLEYHDLLDDAIPVGLHE